MHKVRKESVQESGHRVRQARETVKVFSEVGVRNEPQQNRNRNSLIVEVFASSSQPTEFRSIGCDSKFLHGLKGLGAKVQGDQPVDFPPPDT